MPIDFPSSPTTGQSYSYSGVTYVFTSQGVWASSTPVGVRPGAVGDIRWAFDSTPQSWEVELDGSTIVGGATTFPELAARYPFMVSGSDIILPDARGRFPRIWSHGSGFDPDKAARTAYRAGGPTGDNPTTLQDHEFYSHNHLVNAFIDNSLQIAAGSNYFYGNQAVGGNSNSAGGNETRPFNIYFSAFMRVQ